MATGRLASGSIAAGGATQLYRNSTGNPQVITLLASSQVSGKAPKLNVKITNENFSSSVTTTDTGTTNTLTNGYLALSAQIAGEGNGNSYANAVSTSGSQLHLSAGQQEATDSMGQAFSLGYAQTNSPNSHPWSKVSFGGQPMGLGGTSGYGNYRFGSVAQSLSRSHMPCYPPYYFENPNAFNQNKARGVLAGSNSNNIYHVEDVSKMPKATLKKYYNYYNSAGADYYSDTAPSTDANNYGTITNRSTPQNYADRGWVYDIYTGLFWGWNSAGYSSFMWFDEADPSVEDPTGAGVNWGDASSNGGVWRWSYNSWNGSDPQSYDTDGHGSSYGCYADCENGLIATTSGTYGAYIGFKYYDKYFDNMNNKDTRASNQALEAFSRNSYYHTISYQGTARYLKLQWVSYHPGNNKYYVCFWDNTGTYNASGGITQGTSYPAEAGIFEVDVSKIYGKDQPEGNAYSNGFGQAVIQGALTKVGSVPDTVSGVMTKPMRIADSLWTAHCQNGKQYFSTNLYTWAENTSGTYFSTTYAMRNDSIKGTAGTAETSYFIEAGSTSVIYSNTSTADVYDQAAVAGIIAKGAVTPYEQKSIILSDGDAIYVENEDATNAISITAMGVDV